MTKVRRQGLRNSAAVRRGNREPVRRQPMISISGIGTASRAPHERVNESCSAISSRRFQGRIEDHVGAGFGEAVGREDRDVGAGREAAMLVRIPVDEVLDQVAPDAAIVEQRVGLAGGAVAGDRRALASFVDRGTPAGRVWSSPPARRTRRSRPSGRSRQTARSRGWSPPRRSSGVGHRRGPPIAGSIRHEWKAPRHRAGEARDEPARTARSARV